MKVELEPIDGEAEAYTVRMIEEDGAAQRVALGKVTRAGADEWHFSPHTAPDDGVVGLADDVVLSLTAKDAAELKTVFAQRFGAIEIQADRMRTATMEHFADAVLSSLNVLAAKTSSMPGFAAAIARALATMLVEDVKPENQDVFKTRFMQNVEERAAALRSMTVLREQVHEIMASLFRTDYTGAKDDDDKGPTTH